MSAVRAISSADSWSLSTGLKSYFSCCFSKTEQTPATASSDANADATEPGPDGFPCRRSSSASKNNDDAGDGAFKMVDRRLEADGASVHSAGTDKASSSVAGDHLGADVTSSQGTGALLIISHRQRQLISAWDHFERNLSRWHVFRTV